MSSTIRKIRRILKAKPTLEGAGVHLKRAFGWHHVPELDPFLLLDDFHSARPEDYLAGFPWHPHRGIETITYVIEGKVEHGDSMGNKGVISSGDVQWMTAGSGIIHQEMPKGRADGHLWGFQLWANLPASHKMMEPRYRGIEAREIPKVVVGGGAAKVICGEVEGVRGPVRDVVTEPEYIDVTLPPGASFNRRVRRGHTAFAYVIEGAGTFQPDGDPFDYEIEGHNYFDMKRESVIGPESLVIFDEGDEVAVSAGASGVRFLLVSGKPIGEPVAWWGPIVMNTQEELRVAFEEYERGTFLKHGKK
ncbi:MAG: pirin family protein [Candidatus Krumholzibacteriaceae bacterium]|jgi:redox-sensitive bicupin YhaK (pirin superfamily)